MKIFSKFLKWQIKKSGNNINNLCGNVFDKNVTQKVNKKIIKNLNRIKKYKTWLYKIYDKEIE